MFNVSNSHGERGYQGYFIREILVFGGLVFRCVFLLNDTSYSESVQTSE